MKKIIAPLLLCLVFLVNCDDDDNSAALVGTWIGVSRSVTDCSDPTSNSSTDLDCSDTNCFRLELVGEGRTYSYQQGVLVENGTWDDPGQLLLCQDQEGETLCDEFTIEENTSVTLVLSSTNEATMCKTTISFRREESLNPDDGA